MIHKQDLAIEYLAKKREESRSKASLHFSRVSIKNADDEEYRVNSELTSFSLHASSANIAAFAVERLGLFAQGTHCQEILGESKAVKEQRVLWLQADGVWVLTEKLGVALPSFLAEMSLKAEDGELTLPSELKAFCSHIIDLGYNTVVFSSSGTSTKWMSRTEVSLEEIAQVFRRFGLRLLLRPFLRSVTTTCPFDENYRTQVREGLAELREQSPSLDGLYWESQVLEASFLDHPKSAVSTQEDLVREELRIIEASITDFDLIFMLPCSSREESEEQAKWMSAFVNDVGPCTSVAFPAVAGRPSADHCDDHAFWKALDKELESSATPILPLINVGGIEHGEGLWPSSSVDLLDRFLGKMLHSSISGAICLSPSLPRKGTFLEGSLWVAANCLWSGKSPRGYLEIWLAAYRPEICSVKGIGALDAVRQLAVKVCQLREIPLLEKADPDKAERLRVKAESLISQLNELSVEHGDKGVITDSTRDFQNYITFFVRDSKRMVFNYLQEHRIAIPNVLLGTDMESSYWTAIASSPGRGIGSGASVDLLPSPNRGKEGSVQAALYDEVRPFQRVK